MDEDEIYAASNEPTDIQRDKFGRWVSREWDNGFIEKYNYKHSVKQLTKNKNKRKLRDAFKIDKVVKDKTKKVKNDTRRNKSIYRAKRTYRNKTR